MLMQEPPGVPEGVLEVPPPPGVAGLPAGELLEQAGERANARRAKRMGRRPTALDGFFMFSDVLVSRRSTRSAGLFGEDVVMPAYRFMNIEASLVGPGLAP